jgi:hypothetical protein
MKSSESGAKRAQPSQSEFVCMNFYDYPPLSLDPLITKPEHPK